MCSLTLLVFFVDNIPTPFTIEAALKIVLLPISAVLLVCAFAVTIAALVLCAFCKWRKKARSAVLGEQTLPMAPVVYIVQAPSVGQVDMECMDNACLEHL